MFYKVSVLILAISSITACATNQRIEDLTGEQRARAANMPIFKGKPDKEFIVLGTVSGLSCNRNKYQAQDISEHEALEGVKIHASKLKADAVIYTLCQTNSDTDWHNNCWASVKCVGDAVKYK